MCRCFGRFRNGRCGKLFGNAVQMIGPVWSGLKSFWESYRGLECVIREERRIRKTCKVRQPILIPLYIILRLQ
jgi:hypothetical protein